MILPPSRGLRRRYFAQVIKIFTVTLFSAGHIIHRFYGLISTERVMLWHEMLQSSKKGRIAV